MPVTNRTQQVGATVVATPHTNPVTSTSAPKSTTLVTIDTRQVDERLDVMEPAAHRPDGYEARMQRGSFTGHAVLGDATVQISKSPDGRSASFVAEAGRPLRVVVDPDMVLASTKKVELAWYLSSAGHDTKQRVDLQLTRDMRSGAAVLAPGTIDVPGDASGNLRLSIETTGADGRVSSQWSPHYDAVVMPKSGATVVFDEDWSVTASSTLRGGEALSIAYDADRLRAIVGGEVHSAVACVSFDGKPPLELPLLADGKMLLPSVQVPYDVEKATVWFRGSSAVDGAGDKAAYDSAFGANYTFDVALPKDDADPSWKKMALQIRGLTALTEDNFVGIGPSDGGYNCIAWSLGLRDQWTWPGTTVDAFDALYAEHGYTPLDTLDTRPGDSLDNALAHDPKLEKVVLYGHPAGPGPTGVARRFEATHAARMLADGSWSSKLGTEPLIKHVDPRVVEGPSYGSIARVYVRPRGDV